MHTTRKKNRRSFGAIGVTLIVCCLLGLFFMLGNANQKVLPQYHAEPTTEESSVEETHLIPGEFSLFESAKVQLSMKVPDSWTYAIQEGKDVYVNSADKTTLSIGFTDYYPEVNNESEAAYTNYVSQLSGSLIQYYKIDNSSYSATYQIKDTIYYVAKSWDLSHCMEVMFATSTSLQDYYYDTIVYLFDSIQWQKETPIPESVYIFFNEFGAFQFGVPVDWTTEIINGTLIVQNPTTMGYFTVNVEASDMNLNEITQIQYLNTYGQKQSYLLSSYSNVNGSLSVEASYSENGDRVRSIHNVITANGFLYELKFESLEENFEADRQLYLKAISLFEIFN